MSQSIDKVPNNETLKRITFYAKLLCQVRTYHKI